MASSSSSGVDGGMNRLKSYKNKGLDVEELRRRRETEEIQLRRSKRDEEFSKRRNISTLSESPFGILGEQRFFENTPLEIIIKSIYASDVNEQHQAISYIRKLISVEDDPPISEIISTGVIPKLINNLDPSLPPAIQFESAWVLTNIASGTHYQTLSLIDMGAVPKLVSLITSPNYLVREQVLWALGNIAGDSCECRDIVLSYGAMDQLLLVLEDNQLTNVLKAQACWTLSNFCRGKTPPPNDAIVFKCLPYLPHLIYCDEVEIVSDACWTISFLCEGDNQRIQRVINSGIVRRLVELLMFPKVEVITPSLRAIGNILTGDDVQTQFVINCSVLPALQLLLDHSVSSIRKESCWAISNMTAGNKVQIQAVIDCNIFPKLLQIMDTNEYKIRKEAAWAVLNTTAGGTPYQIRYLVRIGTIPKLCDLLSIHDPKILLVTLEGLDNILKIGQELDGTENQFASIVEESNGLERIESLQNHSQPKISSAASKLVDRYFSVSPDSTTL